MNRRAFISALGGAAACCVSGPPAANAQPGDRMRRVGMLMPYEQDDPEARARSAAIQGVLKELGWSEGRNIDYHFRWAGDDPARLRASAAELVGLRPDVILAPSTIATEALAQATSTIPIVFVNILDPVGSGFAASLPRPGGNITGFATVEPSIGGKWLELLIAIAPATKQVAILFSARSFSMAPGGPLTQTFDADRKHGLGHGDRGQQGAAGLLHDEGGNPRLHPLASRQPHGTRHPRKCGRARPGLDAAQPRRPASRASGEIRGAVEDETRGTARGDCAGLCLPRRAVLLKLHHGRDFTGHRRLLIQSRKETAVAKKRKRKYSKSSQFRWTTDPLGTNLTEPHPRSQPGRTPCGSYRRE
jgi:hypothetical protein